MSMYARLRAPAARLVFKMPVSSPISLSSRLIMAAHRTSSMHASLSSLLMAPQRMASTAAAFAPRQATQNEPQDEAEVSAESQESSSVPFSAIQDSIHPKTYAALTKGPFHYTEMSVVQAEVLPLLPALAEPHQADASPKPQRDLLVKAKTGTGKTIAFLVPAIEARLKQLSAVAAQASSASGLKNDARVSHGAEEAYARKHVGTLVISPTRELAIQIAVEASKLTKHHGHQVHLFVGGENKFRQMRGFDMGRKDIIVATPGRLQDMIESEPSVKRALENINTLVLDEADTLLDMGFRADIESIMSYLPAAPKRQSFLFSATVSPAIQQIARATLDKNYSFINCVKADDSPVHDHIPQHYTALPSYENSFSHVAHLIAQDQLQNPGRSKVMLFCNTTRSTTVAAEVIRKIRKNLPQQRTEIYELHGKIAQNSRRNRSDRFRNDTSGAAVLVTSDVSARGVDYPNVTRVIQLGVPASMDQYVHRVGRTGRGKNLTGRGDLVLLPFEASFPRRSLTEVPIKPITVEKTEGEMLALADEFEANPRAFFKGVNITPSPPRERSSFRNKQPTPTGPSIFTPGVRERLESLDSAIEESLQNVSGEELEGSYTAALGYYVSVAEDLGMRKTDILKPLQDWAEGSLKIQAPYTSEAFLAKIGMKGAGSSGARRRSFSSPRQSSWSAAPRFEDRPRRSSFGGGERSFDRPKRSFDGGFDRPKRSFDRSEGGFERPSRSFDRPSYGDRSSRGDKPAYGGREKSSWGSKEYKPRESYYD